MAINLLRGKARGASAAGLNGPAIGEIDARNFDCPECARPLANGTSRCPGCGTRLIIGVRLRRAGGILGLGLAIGLLVGGGLTVAAIGILFPSAGAAEAVVPAEPFAGDPLATAPVYVVPAPMAAAPSSALTALTGTAVVNGRIAADAAALSAALARSGAQPIEIMRALRSLSADAALGLDLTQRLASWSDAKPVMTELDAFYGAMVATARDGLRALPSDAASYRLSGKAMEAILPKLGTVDASSRDLAATVHLDLPPVALPGS